MRVVVGMSGASGAIYGVRLLEVLKDTEDVQTELIMSPAARQTISLETEWDAKSVEALADAVHVFGDIAGAPSSGSFRFDAMAVVPCSMRTVAAIAYSLSDNLLVRAADVALKERRTLLVAPRETPLHLGHLRAMTQLVEMGALVVPPMPAFYHRPETIDDLVNQTVNRICDLIGISLRADLFERWQGSKARRRKSSTD
ncbi:MAG: UbiX family flavin prenyltransferase [Acidimicrobiales bacterium]